MRSRWIMPGREPGSGQELLRIYAGIPARGASLSAAERARMIRQLSATRSRQAMRRAGDERRLALACQAVRAFMQRHTIAAPWGRADLASSDMLSLETPRRVWRARQDPRRQTASIGIASAATSRTAGASSTPSRSCATSARLRALKQRHLFVAHGMKMPEEIDAACEAGIDATLIATHGDRLVRVAASVEWARQRGDRAGQVRLGRRR